eukprot:CAMPEP_0176347160 /NCGR_PEP_ID=MMETSP0126-20121128/6813_1 /TAXON_ID=141414 ORGANISM="Strombidinopsis acuminatum, Strain SPMC142" /NCGR_SAMPLE_ID=MMETSP0126 /ASSEMBLY_ACC=CAM_ASM_000229 /LENGTH=92 /DNA_ID=CAMNT_0017695125 /DNA_START=1888 /DNA_END=2166 /DNA_ORIENTATION=+
MTTKAASNINSNITRKKASVSGLSSTQSIPKLNLDAVNASANKKPSLPSATNKMTTMKKSQTSQKIQDNASTAATSANSKERKSSTGNQVNQ